MLYRATRQLIRNANTTDKAILSLVANENEEVSRENSNKNAKIAPLIKVIITVAKAIPLIPKEDTKIELNINFNRILSYI